MSEPPVEKSVPFWKLVPDAADPLTADFWIMWAARKCAEYPSAEALWGHLFYADYALHRVCERLNALEPPTSASVKSRLIELEATYETMLPKRCFHPRDTEVARVFFPVGLSHLRDTLDALVESIHRVWGMSEVIRMTSCEDYAETPAQLIARLRKVGEHIPARCSIMGPVEYAFLHKSRWCEVPYLSFPSDATARSVNIPRVAELFSAMESLGIELEDGLHHAGIQQAYRTFSYIGRERGVPVYFTFYLGEKSRLSILPVSEWDVLTKDASLSRIHPLQQLVQQEVFQTMREEYRVWRRFASQPNFQETCKWHPEDEELT